MRSNATIWRWTPLPGGMRCNADLGSSRGGPPCRTIFFCCGLNSMSVPRIVEDIDIRNSRFSGAALQKIRYLLRQDRQTEGQLQFIIDTLAKTHVPDIEFDVYKCELLVGDFLYTPPRERLRPKPQMLTKRT